MKNIEIEFRSIFSKERYDSLLNFLLIHAKHLGQDDKNVFFYLLDEKLLKISDNISRKNAKVTLKLGAIGKSSSFEEIEFFINRSDVLVAKKLFENLGYKNPQESFQKRINFSYKGIEIALKYSKAWGYHAELEKLVHCNSHKISAEKDIRQIADELNIYLLSDAELLNFKKKHDN